MLALICLSGFIASVGQIAEPMARTTYLQEIKTEVQLPEEAGIHVIKLFSAAKDVVAVTSKGVFRYDNGKWTGKAPGSGWRTAAIDAKNQKG